MSQFQPSQSPIPGQPGQSGSGQQYPPQPPQNAPQQNSGYPEPLSYPSQFPQQPQQPPQQYNPQWQQQPQQPPQQYNPQWQQPPQQSQQPPEGTWQPASAPLAPPPYPQQQWQQPQQQQSGAYPSQMQQAMYPGQPVMVMPQQIVNVNIQQKQHGLFVRALYFIFIGSWVGFFWLNLGYFFCFTVIGLPVGLVMLNRLPGVLTLRPNTQQINISVTGNTTNINIGGAQQHSFLIRALYFIFIGSWGGYLWAVLGYGLCLLIVTMPVGLMMLNRLPAVITLRKN